MPTYVCSVPNGKLSDQQKQEIASRTPQAQNAQHFPTLPHDAHTMRRERSFEDDGQSGQDRQQENYAHEVHGIYSLRRTTDAAFHLSRLALSRACLANPDRDDQFSIWQIRDRHASPVHLPPRSSDTQRRETKACP
jgi:hypothetical protein